MVAASDKLAKGFSGFGKLAEFKQRILFLLGAILVFRICLISRYRV